MGTPLSPKYLPSSHIDLRGSRVQLDENRRFEHGICEFQVVFSDSGLKPEIWEPQALNPKLEAL